MYYRMLISKVEDNPAFDAEKLREWEEARMKQYHYGMEPYTVEKEIVTRQLDVVIDEAEYLLVKEAILKAYK